MARAPSPSAPISDYKAADQLATRSMKGYPGSKAASGVAEKIIRQMPPHQVYIEAFAGKAAVWRKKLPAAQSILIDVDSMCCNRLRSYLAQHGVAGSTSVMHGDALEILLSLPAVQDPGTLVYMDPPYLGETRTKKVLYDHDCTTPGAHAAILDAAMSLPCLVMISGYNSDLYAKRLKRWHLHTFKAMTHGGPRIEHLWCNFPEPAILHDPRWSGLDYRERENVKKQRMRWRAKFLAMDPRRRQAIALALLSVDRPSVEAALRSAAADPALLEERS